MENEKILNKHLFKAKKNYVTILFKFGPLTDRAKELGISLCKSQAFVFVGQFAWSQKQLKKLQQLNKLLYKRVEQWIDTVYRIPTIRLSNEVSPDPTEDRGESVNDHCTANGGCNCSDRSEERF